MKKGFLITAIAVGLYYLLREILGKEERTVAPPQKHLTNVFSRAKEHAMKTVSE
jgi:hypothetical protein